MRTSRSSTTRLLAGLAIAATAAGTGFAIAPTASGATTAVKTRAEVPWSSVGSGWIAASVDKGGRNNLILVSPAGQSYQIATLRQGEMVRALSSNGRYALAGSAVYDLKTGAALTRNVMGAHVFTKPTGTALLGTSDNKRVTKYAFDGKISQQGYAAGENDSFWGVLPAPDGLTDVVNSALTVRIVDNASLRTIRTIANPAGMNYCQPRHFVDATTFVMTCLTKTTAQTATVYLQKTNGSPATKVTNGTYPGGYEEGQALGFANTWRTPLGTLASPAAGMAYFKRSLYAVSSGKITKTYSLSLPTDMAKWPLVTDSIIGTSAYMRGNQHESINPTVAIRWDLTTGKVNYLAGSRSQYGGTANGWALAGQAQNQW